MIVYSPVAAGDRIGSLVVTREAGRSRDKHKLWLCVCECGTHCIKQSNSLRISDHPSCGCVARRVNKAQATQHGMKGSPEYSSWQAAIQRCHNPADKDFHRYGAKGVFVCDAWRESFSAFYSRLGPRPKGKTLDRWPDCNGGYEPGNCRWATPKEQAENRRNAVRVVGPHGVKSLAEVADSLGLTYGAASMRLRRGKLNDFYRL